MRFLTKLGIAFVVTNFAAGIDGCQSAARREPCTGDFDKSVIMGVAKKLPTFPADVLIAGTTIGLVVGKEAGTREYPNQSCGRQTQKSQDHKMGPEFIP